MSKLLTRFGVTVVSACFVTGGVYAGSTDLMKRTFEREPVGKLATVTSKRSSETPVPLKARHNEPSLEQKSVLLFEDFSNVPDGETETIASLGERRTTLIASGHDVVGKYINNEYTPESGTWEGDWVYAGENGTVVLQCYNPMVGAHLSTPLGDYSGDLTVTMRVRWAPSFFGSGNEVGYVGSTGTTFSIHALVGGYEVPQSAKSEIGSYGLSSNRFYEPYGWQELTFKFRNESANNDGHLQIFCNDAVEIDWIKVTDDDTFLAAPTIEPISDCTEDSFTINWQPVRRSFGYYFDLWKTVYTGDGVDLLYDFNDGTLPEGVTAEGCAIAENQGTGGSSALMLGNGGLDECFSTPDYGVGLDSFETKLKFELGNADNMDAMVIYEGLGSEGWVQLGYLNCDGYWTPADQYVTVKLNGNKFEGQYSAIRIFTQGLTENDRVYIDDIKAFALRPYELERVWEEFSSFYDPDDDDYGYNYYDSTESHLDPTHYTFMNLEPESEYWYRVRSHYMYDFSVSEKMHALYVLPPVLKEVTGVEGGSYTAAWNDVPKAQNYTVTNYKVERAEAGDREHTIFLETFSGCEGGSGLGNMRPLGNTDGGNLDEYTDYKGWTGSSNLIGDGMIGVAEYSYGYVQTPPLMLNPYRGECLVYVEAVGFTGDKLLVMCEKSGVKGTIDFDESGMISAWFILPEPVAGEEIAFESYYYMEFALTGFEVVQEVYEGDYIRTFDSRAKVGAGVQNYTFTGLDESGTYAFDVVSEFKSGNESVTSSSHQWMLVDMTSGGSYFQTKVDEIASDAYEISRHTVDGRRVSEDYKGIVIIRMSDGSARKRVVK